MAGLVAQALGRQDEQQEEQQEPVDNPQEEAAEGGKQGAASWNGDKVLQTATKLAFETLYSDGGIQALEERMANSQDLPSDMADIVANAMRAAMAKAQGNGRTIPEDALDKLAKTLVFEVLQVAEIMGLMQKEQGAGMARQVLQMALQAFAQPKQPQQQPPQGAAGMVPQQAEGM
jgi:hypothetical protein